ncbi:MAG: hypothetical protein RR635_11405, partial [Oscillospiraceae bacterium]
GTSSPDSSSTSVPDASSEGFSSSLAQSSVSNSVPSSSSDIEVENVPEAIPPFIPLAITEQSTTFNADIGDVVGFFVKLNRDDVVVNYQWQQLCNEEKPLQTEAIYDYGEGESTSYKFPFEGTTEEETLRENPDATWPGIELYYAALKKVNGDVSKVQIETNAPNIVLDGET